MSEMAAAAPAELIVTGPDGAVAKIRLPERAVIGRHPECEIVLTDPMSSRRHCKVERTPQGNYVVEDIKSANGTSLNGEPLRPSTPVTLRNGDSIQIGATTLMLKLDVPARVGPPPPAVKLDDDDAPLSFIQKVNVNVVSQEEEDSDDVKTLKKVAGRLKLLIDVGQALGTSLELPKLLNTCLEKMFEVFPQADRGLVLLYGPDGSLPSLVTSDADLGSALAQRKTGMALSRLRNPGTTAHQAELKISRTVLNRVRTEKSAVLMEKSGSMSLVDISSVMCAPMLVGQDDLGLLYLETRKIAQAFTKDDLSVMTAVAGQIAVVIRNSDLARQAAAEAAHKESLSRFLSPQLVDQMLKGNLSVQLGGTEKKGTIFFSDIVGFTKLASKMKAEAVVTLLNRYFTVMQNIIFRRGGSIDKCAGDNIMAHWGVVGDMPNFTGAAVTAAVEMQIALFIFNRDEAQKKEIVLPPTPLGHGLGLNTGIVCAGNIGSDRKIEFTVIGDPVNLSARIEAMAGRFQTFLGEPTFEEIRQIAFCFRMPDCPAKNVEKPLPVYSVRGIIPQMAEVAPPVVDPATLKVEDLVLSMPCYLESGELKMEGMVTRLQESPTGTRIVMQAERPLPIGTPVTLIWNLPEKPSLSNVPAEVEKSYHDTGKPPSGETSLGSSFAEMLAGAAPQNNNTAVISNVVPHGTIVLVAKEVPEDFLQIRPGSLLQSDLTSHDQIIRV
ncbi:MAG TPA: adenylate/guanylate cyclase domain-containing protein [Planctomycetota bacterium]|nr:adenylate/guanylate cyclase domain-containing protein [Planctomycetota bacterium]